MTDVRVALVTGASRGIGAAIALTLARTGICVAGTSTSAAGAAEVTARLASAGCAGCGVELRVEDDSSVSAALREVEAAFGMPSILVNNAGVTRDGLLVRMRIQDWANVIDTNLTGAFRLASALSKGMMRARWGRIINVSSVVARMGNAGQSNYVAAKAGLEGLTRAMAKELASRGITVNAVSPGFIDTDMTAQLNEDQRAAMRSLIPLGKFGSPDDVAKLVAFLASDDAAYITGQCIQVNGGMYMD